jgi:PPP family 3-phenylpropionic acid transporter
MTDARFPIRPTIALRGTFVLFGFVIASFFPFFALFLSDRGLSPADVGVVIAAMAVARIIANPIWGSLADQRLGRRRVIRIGLTGGIAAALLLSAIGQGLPLVLITAFSLALFNGQLFSNLDAYALAQLGDRAMADYGRVRAWESLSYALGCICFGLLLQATGVTWLMFVNAACMSIVLAWTLTLASDRPEHRREHGRMGAVGAVFRGAPRYWGFLAGALFVWTGFNGAWNFLALRIASRGGGPLLIGIGTAAGGLVEVGVMLISGRLTRRIGLRSVYGLGAAVYALAFLLWGLIASPVAISLLAVFEGAGFALLFTGSVLIVGQLVPRSLYSTGQSLSSTVAFGIGPIVGGAVGGWVYEHLGAPALYLGSAVLAVIGGTIVWLTLTGPAFRRRGTERPAPVEPAAVPS